MAEYDMEDAIKKAEKFLEERHSTINLKSAELEDDVWHLIFDVGFLTEQFKEVRVNANSGKILGYVNVDVEDNDDD